MEAKDTYWIQSKLLFLHNIFTWPSGITIKWRIPGILRIQWRFPRNPKERQTDAKLVTTNWTCPVHKNRYLEYTLAFGHFRNLILKITLTPKKSSHRALMLSTLCSIHPKNVLVLKDSRKTWGGGSSSFKSNENSGHSSTLTGISRQMGFINSWVPL